MAWRIARSTREAVVPCILATVGYSSFVTLLIISGTGEVIEPDGGICAIGSGGNYALAAARALYAETDYGAEEIARKALKIASEICVYTNGHLTVETL